MPSVYGESIVARWMVRIVACVAVAFAFVTTRSVLHASMATPADLSTVVLFAVVWAVVPPVWSWFDYFYLFRCCGDRKQLEEFKHGQQVSAAVWAAIAVTLAALASSDHFDRPQDPVPCSCACTAPKPTTA